MIGYYIVEFEQNGKNRAEYGTRLLENMAKRIDIKGIDRQMLNTCRIFYTRYPQICETVSRKLKSVGYVQNLPDFTEMIVDVEKDEICETASRKFETPPETLISRLPFSHIKEGQEDGRVRIIWNG